MATAKNTRTGMIVSVPNHYIGHPVLGKNLIAVDGKVEAAPKKEKKKTPAAEVPQEIIEEQSSKPQGALRRRLCATVFLINKLPDTENSLGIRADAAHLADLLTDSLTVGADELRKNVPLLLNVLIPLLLNAPLLLIKKSPLKKQLKLFMKNSEPV